MMTQMRQRPLVGDELETVKDGLAARDQILVRMSHKDERCSGNYCCCDALGLIHTWEGAERSIGWVLGNEAK